MSPPTPDSHRLGRSLGENLSDRDLAFIKVWTRRCGIVLPFSRVGPTIRRQPSQSSSAGRLVMRNAPMPRQSRLVDRQVTVATPSPRELFVRAKEGTMGVIMIACPSTGRAVSTGIETMEVE